MRERAAELVALQQSPDSHSHVCGVKGMEEGAVMALRDTAIRAGMGWSALSSVLKEQV